MGPPINISTFAVLEGSRSFIASVVPNTPSLEISLLCEDSYGILALHGTYYDNETFAFWTWKNISDVLYDPGTNVDQTSGAPFASSFDTQFFDNGGINSSFRTIPAVSIKLTTWHGDVATALTDTFGYVNTSFTGCRYHMFVMHARHLLINPKWVLPLVSPVQFRHDRPLINTTLFKAS